MQIVIWVQSGEAALDMLATAGNKFDLVCSDVIMPGINGLELARKIQERWPALRIVLTSGYSRVLAEESDHLFELLRKPIPSTAYSVSWAKLSLTKECRDHHGGRSIARDRLRPSGWAEASGHLIDRQPDRSEADTEGQTGKRPINP